MFYLKSGREELHSIYLMYFVKGIRFGLTKVLIQITRKTSKKKSFFNWKHTNGFHSSYQTLWTFSRSYCQTMLHTFPDIKQR